MTETRLWEYGEVRRYVNVMRVWADLHAIVSLNVFDEESAHGLYLSIVTAELTRFTYTTTLPSR